MTIVKTSTRLIFKILLAAGAEVNALSGSFNETALAAAARRGSEEGVALLLDASADPNMRQGAGDHTAFHCAVFYERLHSTDRKTTVNILHQLLHAGANINALSSYGRSPLAIATEKRTRDSTPRMDVIPTLVEAGADVKLSDSSYNTPLHNAAASGNIEIVKYLLGAGARM
jgi:ankyrin repeat protein